MFGMPVVIKCNIAKSVFNDHLGSSNDLCYIQKSVIMSSVIKRLKGILYDLKIKVW